MASRLPELFSGFETRLVDTGLAQLFCRIGGSGPPLLLLHGYPQSHVIWHKIAPRLAERFTLIMPDLPGYGQSSVPALSGDQSNYSKRATANAMLQLMRALGYETFFLAGHDRGGRVAYRLALDSPKSVKKVAVLDILPTLDYWDRLERSVGLKIYHWMFLAQPAPFPENLIAASPLAYLDHTLASWTATGSLHCFSEGALEHNRAWFTQPERIAATCEDYRAGAGIDYAHDQSDQQNGKVIMSPLLVLTGDKGIAKSVDDPVKIWQRWSSDVSGRLLNAGHFIPEEAASETAEELLRFMA